MGSGRLTRFENEIDVIVNVKQWAGEPDERRDMNRKRREGNNPAQQYLGMAEEGNAVSQRKLGEVYAQQCGEKGKREAADWWRKAADNGDAEALNYLAAAYAGGIGVSQDFTEAYNWWRKAAEKEYDNPRDYRSVAADAQRYIAHLFTRRNLLKTDYAEAYYWSSLAAANLVLYDGYSHAREQTNDLSKAIATRLSSERLAEVQKRLDASPFYLVNRAKRGDAIEQLTLDLPIIGAKEWTRTPAKV